MLGAMRKYAGIVFALALLAGRAFPQGTLAPTPPMGWNSWDSFGTGVTEGEVKANADYMAGKLARHGWQYIVVDIQWFAGTGILNLRHGYRPPIRSWRWMPTAD